MKIIIDEPTLKFIFKEDQLTYPCILSACAIDLSSYGDSAHPQLICCVMRNIISAKNVPFYYGSGNNDFTFSYLEWRAKALASDITPLKVLIQNGDPDGTGADCIPDYETIYTDNELFCDFLCEACPA